MYLKTYCLLNRVHRSNLCQLRNLARSGVNGGAYDAEGKTTVTLLNQERDARLMIDTYSTKGFRLNNGVFVLGPAIIFPKTVVSWKIHGDREVTKDSLSLISILEPKLDILVVGLGDGKLHWKTVEAQLMDLRLKQRVNVELLPVDKAVGTFNMLVAEDRWVAAALLPPATVQTTNADIGLMLSRGIAESQ